MGNLVPEKRIDKNGRAVTRRVKMPSPPVESKFFAPLKLHMSSMLNEGRSEAASLLMDSLFAQSSNASHGHVKPDGSEVSMGLGMLLSGVSDDSLNTVSERVASMSQQERSLVSETLSEIDCRAISLSGEPELAEGMLHYSTELAPDIVTFSATGTSTKEMHNAAMHINAEIAANFRGRELRLMFADDAEKAVVRGAAVNHLLTGAFFENKNVLTLSWIGNNLDQIEKYKEIIRARGTMDRKFIEELMKSDVSSLAGGYL